MSARCPRGGIWTLTEGDGFVSTVYEPTTRGTGWSLTRMLALPDVAYDGTEGELYDVREDPHQWRNLWNGYRQLRSDLVADLRDHLPRPRATAMRVEAPA